MRLVDKARGLRKEAEDMSHHGRMYSYFKDRYEKHGREQDARDGNWHRTQYNRMSYAQGLWDRDKKEHTVDILSHGMDLTDRDWELHNQS